MDKKLGVKNATLSLLVGTHEYYFLKPNICLHPSN